MLYDKPPIDEYLEHHGIKGQKWGVRRFQNKDGTLTSAGKHRYDESGKESNKKKGLTENQKRTLKIGAAAVATALTVYGAYKLVNSGELNRLVAKGKAFLTGTKDVEFKKADWLADKMSADEIADAAFWRINPGYGVNNSLGRTNNCRRCTFAYEMMRRGYDVEATATLDGTGQNMFGLAKATGNRNAGMISLIKKIKDIAVQNPGIEKSDLMTRSKEAFVKGYKDISFQGSSLSARDKSKKIFDYLSKMPERARGELQVKWNIGKSGHSMAWEIIDGKPIIFDCQTREMFKLPSDFDLRASMVSSASAIRLDNIDLDFDFLSKWVKNR